MSLINAVEAWKSKEGKMLLRTTDLDGITYPHKLAQLKELELRGVDITILPLLVNNRNITITLNDGTLIYTE